MTAALVLAALLQAPAEQPSLAAVLERTQAYLERCYEKLTLVRATERSQQTARFRNDPVTNVRNPSTTSAGRVLVSDVLWVPSEEPGLLAFYRDVYSVDGTPVRDRADRLLRLFPEGATAKGREQANEILDESARFNLGRGRWNANFPTLALGFLYGQSRARFEFRERGRSKLDGRPVLELEFREVGRPTVTRSSEGNDVVASGVFWIASDDGAVLKSDLHYKQIPARFRVSYRSEPKLGILVPEELHVTYGGSQSVQQVDGVSRYTDYRRGDAEIGALRFK